VSRVSAAHKAYVEPHVNTAGEYAYAGAKTGHEYYRFAADHPVTQQAKHAQTAFGTQARIQRLFTPSLMPSLPGTRLFCSRSR
jgi:cytochrome c biogenesis protein ResB